MTFIAQTRHQYTSSHDGCNDLRRHLKFCASNECHNICAKLNVWTNLRLCRVNCGEETHNSAFVPLPCGRGWTPRYEWCFTTLAPRYERCINTLNTLLRAVITHLHLVKSGVEALEPLYEWCISTLAPHYERCIITLPPRYKQCRSTLEPR